ncbi:hypothetical protein [Actinocatenispora rupis]|uniref:Uncharacterized protein n=1 Tax=Actinocatenispora rupis TaxID=519421 RepID=A0A8J3JG25_9ACTN|nr:hypothetical protein [Actinocatenispora rupis]GID15747.1 hypothetical protein Aru02nite_66360 [Actinocatenispora rupis]
MPGPAAVAITLGGAGAAATEALRAVHAVRPAPAGHTDGHGDLLVVADAGLPVPREVEVDGPFPCYLDANRDRPAGPRASTREHPAGSWSVSSGAVADR